MSKMTTVCMSALMCFGLSTLSVNAANSISTYQTVKSSLSTDNACRDFNLQEMNLKSILFNAGNNADETQETNLTNVYAKDYPFSGGKGTKANPYQIATPEDLVMLSENVGLKVSYEGEYFKMTQDIDMQNVSDFTPIGNNFGENGNDLKAFRGVFDGDGHTISNLHIAMKGKNHIGVGLFGITLNAVVKGITFVDCSFTADAIVAAVVGVSMGGEIIDCHVGRNVEVKATKQPYAGGIVAASMDQGTKVDRCSNQAPVAAMMGAGGIMGTNAAFGTKISRCINYGDIEATMDIAGGILGYSEMTVTVSDCGNVGAVAATQKVAAGIVGALSPQVPGPLTIYNTYNNGLISSGEEDYHMPITVMAMAMQQVGVTNSYYDSSLFTTQASYGTPLTPEEMQNGTLEACLNGNHGDIWVSGEGEGSTPTPFGGDTSIEDVPAVETPQVTVADGCVVAPEGYSVVRLFDVQGKSYVNAALPAGVYVAVVCADGELLKPMSVKVVVE